MPVGRLFYDGPLAGTIELIGDEGRHLSKVLRARPGDSIELANGRGDLATATIRALQRDSVQLQIESVTHHPEPTPQLILYQALPRLNRLDTIIEKATELGASQICLFPGERSEVPQLNPAAQRRVEAILRAAVKQSGRLYQPKLLQLPLVKSWTELPASSYVGDPRPSAPSLSSIWTPPTNSVAIIIGSESGLTEKEMTHLQQLGAKPVRLHPNVLRTDTAPIVALSLMSHWLWCG
jgi:16S rRNA (uracil1498-N3)-methyltransferase